MVLAQMIGILLDHVGRNAGTLLVANLTGFALLIGTAYGVRWLKAGEATSKRRS